jgi:hypothetical protein
VSDLAAGGYVAPEVGELVRVAEAGKHEYVLPDAVLREMTLEEARAWANARKVDAPRDETP